jgi:2-dehydro-3-deoxygalactonokinase
MDSLPPAGLAWIGVDWGTSHMRAYAMAEDGGVAAQASGPGMRSLVGGDFEGALLGAIGGWLGGWRGQRPLPVVLCGMVGSRQGWQEARYLPVPQDLGALGGALTAVDTRDKRLQAFLVPGLAQHDPFDVMRGEETQLAGYLAQDGQADLVCLPGTHAKWAQLRGNRVTHFTTAMTGELFELLSERSILALSMRQGSADEGMDAQAFADAVQQSYHAPQGLMSALFSVRAEGLLRHEDGARARGRLSGLLIGAELAGVRLCAGRRVALIGEPALCAAYRDGLALVGLDGEVMDGRSMVLAGLASIHRQLLHHGLRVAEV